MTEPEKYPLLGLDRLRMGTDGAGVTTLVAGKGCPLACKWCINAQVLQKEPRLVSPQELFALLKRDDLYFRATGGGVSFGGGESLLHARFIRAFRQICGENWRIYAETSLHVPKENLEIAASCVDEFIVDIKDTDEEIYHRYTGGNGEIVCQNLEFLLKAVSPERIWVRVPLIPEFNTPAQQKRSVEILKSMGLTKIESFSYINPRVLG